MSEHSEKMQTALSAFEVTGRSKNVRGFVTCSCGERAMLLFTEKGMQSACPECGKTVSLEREVNVG